MGRKQEKEIIRHETLEDLNKKIKREEKSVRVLERLYFIRFLYKGDSIKEACEKVNITEPTGYSWLDSWNKQGYVGLLPNFSGGPKPKLGNSEREELKKLLAEKNGWTLREVRLLVLEKFNVEYSEMQVWRILTSWNMHHAKPYVLDNRRPEDAENVLKKTRNQSG
jgi:transposase